jgi:hypothetical protein
MSACGTPGMSMDSNNQWMGLTGTTNIVAKYAVVRPVKILSIPGKFAESQRSCNLLTR